MTKRSMGQAALAAAMAMLVMGGAAAAEPYRPIAGHSRVQDANFYLLTLIEQDPAARAAIAGDPALRDLARALRARAEAAAAACEAVLSAYFTGQTPDPSGCDLNRLRWTAEETAAAAAAAGRAFDRSPALRALVDAQMRPSRFFARYEGESDREMFMRAWTDAHAAIDRIIRIYGAGETPDRFADIDSIIYPADGTYYRGLVANLIRAVAADPERVELAYDAPRDFALELMSANRRDDAVRQADIDDRENAAAAARLSTIDWRAYRYGAILVPGHSPEIAYEPLNPNAVLRLRTALAHYRAGLAPVIIVSGASLRPIGTTFTEALEMKRWLMREHNIPEDAILVDAVARHTTTNMRNAARLIAKHGIPFDRPSLVVGNSVPYIASDGFRERCLRELGYMPFTTGRRIDFDTLEFTPSPLAFHRDAHDPMDP